MHARGPDRSRTSGGPPAVLLVLALLLVAVVFGAGAGSAAAAAPQVNIVRQGNPPATIPANTHYYKTIQAAVNASTSGDWVLIEPGVYYESVKVTAAQSGIWIRGMDRNEVILDGQNEPGNGIEIYKANNVWVENLTVRNFDTGCSECGNEIWWNGGADSGEIGAHGWYGRYLTAYDTGLNGGYGIFTGNEEHGVFEHVYASGFNDSGMYIGACRDCDALVSDAVMENNALGYSGSNSSGRLIIEKSVFDHNLVGIAPNSENPGDGPPPLDGACNSGENTSPTPTFESTRIKRCEILRKNQVMHNDNLTVPTNGSTDVAPWGVGIELPGDYAVMVKGNTIADNPNNGVLGFEYPNPVPSDRRNHLLPVRGKSDQQQLVRQQRLQRKPAPERKSLHRRCGLLSGYAELFGGPTSQSENNCVSGNHFSGATFPPSIDKTWGCNNKNTPNPGGGLPAAEYLLTLLEESRFIQENLIPPVGQPAPPKQPTMPNPCKGAPKNPLCPQKGNH